MAGVTGSLRASRLFWSALGLPFVPRRRSGWQKRAIAP